MYVTFVQSKGVIYLLFSGFINKVNKLPMQVEGTPFAIIQSLCDYFMNLF